MLSTSIRRAAVAALVLATAGCTVHDTETPALAGPSGLGLTLRLSASPDTINQDGGSRSTVTVSAIDHNGRAMSGLPLRVDMAVSGTPQDYGTLSARTLTTGSDGTASVVYTAPQAPANGTFLNNCGLFGAALPGTCVSIVATATGSNIMVANPESVDIRLVPTGMILPPAGSPTAAFTVTPTPVQLNVPVTFDGSTSTPGVNASTLTYAWNFGDGGSASGQRVSHAFTQVGNFTVTLSVTNERGLSASATQPIDVGVSPLPSGDWVFSPAAPQPNQDITFNAAGVRPAPGHSIVSYLWQFGDTTPSQTGSLTTHRFAAEGSYNVVLTVTDDVGQTLVVVKAVPVKIPTTTGGGN
jgi:PKD repeat protein